MHLSTRARLLLLGAAVLLLAQFVVLAILVDADLAATVGAYTTAVLALAAVLPALAGWQPFAPRPELDLRLELSGPALATAGHGRPWIDVEVVVDEQRKAALATLPPRPAPDTSFDHIVGTGLQSLGRALSASAVSAFLSEAPTDDERAAFVGKVDAYKNELRSWLGGLEPAVWARCSQLELRVVIENTSSRAPARDLDVDVDLPAGIRPSSQPDEPDKPPTRPRWHRPDPFAYGSPFIDPRLPRIRPRRLRPCEDLRDRPDGSGLRWSVALPALLHARTSETSRELKLELDGPGNYRIEAAARTTGLDDPVTQTTALEVDGRPGRQLASMRELSQYLRLNDDQDQQ